MYVAYVASSSQIAPAQVCMPRSCVAPASVSRRAQQLHVRRRLQSSRHLLYSPLGIHRVQDRCSQCSRTAQIARAQDYSKRTIVKLKEELRERGLPLAGSKAVIVRRLQDNDAEKNGSSTTFDSSDSAQLFPDGGPMPEFSQVTKSELLQELRRRGDPILARSKIDLYERLQQLVLNDVSGFMPGSSPTPITDVSGNPTYPVADQSTLSSDKEAAFEAARSIVTAPDFNPEATTAIELNSILQGLKLPSSGRKAEMIFRVKQFVESQGQGGTPSQMPAAAGPVQGSPEEVAEVRAVLEQMSDEEVVAALRSQGVSITGAPRSLRERLELMLLVEARAERGDADDGAMHALEEQARDEVCADVLGQAVFCPCRLVLLLARGAPSA